MRRACSYPNARMQKLTKVRLWSNAHLPKNRNKFSPPLFLFSMCSAWIIAACRYQSLLWVSRGSDLCTDNGCLPITVSVIISLTIIIIIIILISWSFDCNFRSWSCYMKWWWLLLFSAILRARADSLRSHVILHEWLAFYSAFLTSTEVAYLQRWHGWCHMKLQPSRRKSCVHHTTMHHVTSCKAKYVRCMGV